MPINQETIQRGSFDEFGNIAVREITRFVDSVTGEVIAESRPHTKTIQPGDDITEVKGMAKEIAEKIHTDERKQKMAQMRSTKK